MICTQIIIQLFFSFAKNTMFPQSFLILSDLIPVSSIYGLFPLFFLQIFGSGSSDLSSRASNKMARADHTKHE